MQALIIIDQQKGIDHPKLGQRNNLHAEQAILRLLTLWRTHQWPIFHVQHKSTQPDSVFWPLQVGVEFKPGFAPQKGEGHIEKSVPCAFVNNTLQQELEALGIKQLVIVGVATNNSVEATARTGGNLGFAVSVVEDACFTFAKADYFGTPRSAEDVHGMSLANLHNEYATVTSSEALIAQLFS